MTNGSSSVQCCIHTSTRITRRLGALSPASSEGCEDVMRYRITVTTWMQSDIELEQSYSSARALHVGIGLNHCKLERTKIITDLRCKGHFSPQGRLSTLHAISRTPSTSGGAGDAVQLPFRSSQPTQWLSADNIRQTAACSIRSGSCLFGQSRCIPRTPSMRRWP